MTRGPGEEDPEGLGGHAAERFRQFSDQRYPDGIPYSPLPEDPAEEEQESDAGEDREGSMEEGEADTGPDPDLDPTALGGHAAERLRELAGRLFTESVPTIAAVGDIRHVMDQNAVSRALGTRAPQAAE